MYGPCRAGQDITSRHIHEVAPIRPRQCHGGLIPFEYAKVEMRARLARAHCGIHLLRGTVPHVTRAAAEQRKQCYAACALRGPLGQPVVDLPPRFVEPAMLQWMLSNGARAKQEPSSYPPQNNDCGLNCILCSEKVACRRDNRIPCVVASTGANDYVHVSSS